MPNYSKNIVYLSQAQYQELITNQTITVDGVTVTYNENDIYVTPQAEPVTDVRVNGTSITQSGLANIPVADQNTFGVAKIWQPYGIRLYNGTLRINPAQEQYIKGGSEPDLPIVPSIQHTSTFYGLSKAAGADLANEQNITVGTYTDNAKAAIQQMLGVSSLIAPSEPTLIASKAYAVGDVFTANGKLYKVTTAIAAAETIVVQNDGETVSGHNAEECKVTDYAVHDVQANGTSMVTNGVANIPLADNQLGLVRVRSSQSFGVKMDSAGNLDVRAASDDQIKGGTVNYIAVTPSQQHKATFYGLAKVAGDITQSASDNAVGTYTNEAKVAIKNMIGVNVEDVQMMGTSVLTNGVANIPIGTTAQYGVVRVGNSYGAQSYGSGNSQVIGVLPATDAKVKAGTENYHPLVPSRQHQSVFYGLAKAAGDTTQSASSNAVGTYTDSAKASIKSMLGIVDGSTGTVDVTGTTPTITAVENTRYVCGEVATLTITPPASGICIIRFTSGTTATVLTATGVVWPEWFDATALEASRVYEICITDGYGAVMSWAQ